jgi:dihydroneopterin triphosphate diphosphatase
MSHANPTARLKLPVSVLVVVHTPDLDVLLLERSGRPGYWQSVTGSLDRPDEPLEQAALREVREETGLGMNASVLRDLRVCNTFEIFPEWRHRFVPGTTYNTEHVFSLEVPARAPVRISPGEHDAFAWHGWREAAERCFSWSNRDAIRMLAGRRHASVAG